MRDAGAGGRTAEEGLPSGGPIGARDPRSAYRLLSLAALPPALMMVGLAVLALSESSLDKQKVQLSVRISEQRRNIEPVTSIRRDARKSYVALLERWLSPPQDWRRAARDLDAQVAALIRSSQNFVAQTALSSLEQQHRAALSVALTDWNVFVSRMTRSDAGSEFLGEARGIIAGIDRECAVILTSNLHGATSDEALRAEVERRFDQIGLVVAGLRVLLVAYLVVWYLRVKSARRLAEAIRQQREREAQNLVLERLVRERTAELQTSHAQLGESMAQLSSAKGELEVRVNELATAHNQLVQAEKLQAVGQLAAGIAHEINTPIQFIADSLHFLKEGLVGYQRLFAQYRCALDAIGATGAGQVLVGNLRQAEDDLDIPYLEANVPAAVVSCLDGVLRISTIVEAMKEFAKPDQRQKELADLNRALQATLTVARGAYGPVAEITTDLGDLPLVLCHVGDLNQVFLNLIVNAAHAIEDRGAKGTIGVRTMLEGNRVRIDITDSGCGIPEGIRGRVFEPFFTTREVGKGTGQGLAIARSVVVVKHGGTLTFESEVGRGTTFTIRLPLGSEKPGMGPAVNAGRA